MARGLFPRLGRYCWPGRCGPPGWTTVCPAGWPGGGRRGRRTIKGKSSPIWRPRWSCAGLPGRCDGAARPADRLAPDARPGRPGPCLEPKRLRLRLAETWPWATQLTAAITRLHACTPSRPLARRHWAAPTTRKDTQIPWYPARPARQPGSHTHPDTEDQQPAPALSRAIQDHETSRLVLLPSLLLACVRRSGVRDLDLARRRRERRQSR